MILFIGLFGLFPLVAQDTTTTCYNKKTLVIRKKKINQAPQTNAAIAIVAEKETAPSLSPTTAKKTISDENKKGFRKAAQPSKKPTLAGGDFGLMNVQPYREGMDLKNWAYVCLQYSIDRHGWACKVDAWDTNDPKLKELVLRQLKKSKWNPAISQLGEPMEYRMYKQVVIVKDRIYEEDYYGNE